MKYSRTPAYPLSVQHPSLFSKYAPIADNLSQYIKNIPDEIRAHYLTESRSKRLMDILFQCLQKKLPEPDSATLFLLLWHNNKIGSNKIGNNKIGSNKTSALITLCVESDCTRVFFFNPMLQIVTRIDYTLVTQLTEDIEQHLLKYR